MAIIGTFKKEADKFSGQITTLTVKAKVELVPNTTTGEDNAPQYRMFAGKCEIGAAWEKTSERTGKTYLSVKLDDPSFPDAIYAAVHEQDDGGYVLVWNRRR